MNGDELTRRQILDALDGMLTSIAKLHEQVITLRRKAEGQNPIGDILKFFDDAWRLRYNLAGDEHYTFNGSVDAPSVKRWLKTMDALTIQTRITRYFADRDEFLTRHKHPFNLFIKGFNSYAVAADPEARGKQTTRLAQAVEEIRQDGETFPPAGRLLL
jgi:thiamine monophosphate kinase